MMTARRVVIASLVAALLALTAATGAARPRDRQTEILVLFEEGTSFLERGHVHALAGGTETGYIAEVDIARVTAPPGTEKIYAAMPSVETAVVSRPMHIMGQRPNDPLVDLQWGLGAVGAFDAWRLLGKSPEEVIVAVIDTGVDSNHIDLEGRVMDGFDFVGRDETPQDDHGHGTHISGVIAANSSNRKGVAGLSEATILPVKVCAAEGSCDPFAIYEGVVDAVRRGAQVLNLSLGGAGDCTAVDQAVFDWAFDQGVLTVAAAGNSAKPDNPTIAPANCDHTLGVGAIDEKLRKARFSSYGDFVDIAAPGVDIWSTLPPLVTLTSEYIGYGSWQGTSMAAPYVAGAAAVLKAEHPDWGPAEIEAQLLETARDLGEKGRDDLFGHGLLDLAKALR